MGDGVITRSARGDRVMGSESNFLNFLNFRGIRNSRKFAFSSSLGLTDLRPLTLLAVWPSGRLPVRRYSPMIELTMPASTWPFGLRKVKRASVGSGISL